MKWSSWIAMILCVGVWLTVFRMQWERNRAMKQRIETEEQALRRLPPLDSEEVSCSRAHVVESAQTVLPERPAATVLGHSLGSASRARVLQALLGIRKLCEDVQNPQTDCYSFLPEMVELIRDLTLEEALDLAHSLDNRSSAFCPAVAEPVIEGFEQCLFLLVAEVDPIKMLESGPKSGSFKRGLLTNLARHDPELARAWLEESDLPESERNYLSTHPMLQLLRDDPEKGLQWLREGKAQGNGHFNRIQFTYAVAPTPKILAAMRQELVTSVDQSHRAQIIRLALNGALVRGEGVSSWHKIGETLGLTKEDLRAYLLAEKRQVVSVDPRGGLSLMLEYLTVKEFRHAVSLAMERWVRDDYRAAGEWVKRLEPSPQKDAALSAYALLIVDVAPTTAMHWAAQISDFTEREASLKAAFLAWRRHDYNAAGEWLERVESSTLRDAALSYHALTGMRDGP